MMRLLVGIGILLSCMVLTAGIYWLVLYAAFCKFVRENRSLFPSKKGVKDG